MTTLLEATNAAYSRFLANWTGTAASQVVLLGEDSDLDSGEDSWVEVSAQEIGGGQDTLGGEGNRIFRRKARFTASIRTLTRSGTEERATLAHEARTIMEAVSFSGLDFTDADVRYVGIDGKWDITNVVAYFDYDEVK